jgi:hypothetical protein
MFMSVSSGVGAFATAKRKAREAAGREAAPVLLCSKVQPNNTNKLARFASLDVDQRRVDHLSTTAAASESKDLEETAASASLIKSSGRCHASAAGGGSASAVATASVSKRTLQGPSAVPGVTGSVSANAATLDGTAGAAGAGAKRISAFTTSPPQPPCSGGSGSSSPVAVILSKRASDDIAHAGGWALEKRTNDGGQQTQRDRRNSD